MTRNFKPKEDDEEEEEEEEEEEDGPEQKLKADSEIIHQCPIFFFLQIIVVVAVDINELRKWRKQK